MSMPQTIDDVIQTKMSSVVQTILWEYTGPRQNKCEAMGKTSKNRYGQLEKSI